jgi:hypothetical protein
MKAIRSLREEVLTCDLERFKIPISEFVDVQRDAFRNCVRLPNHRQDCAPLAHPWRIVESGAGISNEVLQSNEIEERRHLKVVDDARNFFQKISSLSTSVHLTFCLDRAGVLYIRN